MSIDAEKAKNILNKAYIEAKEQNYTNSNSLLSKSFNWAVREPNDKYYNISSLTQFIDKILDNTHKTYKYILVNALLAKATDPSINPLALQAGAALDGAYDARSLCHSVLVPFEMNNLGRALGGSNEPFLNKPARATHLDKSNPVRRGNDQMLLNLLCDNLPLVTGYNAYKLLIHALNNLIDKSKVYDDINDLRPIKNDYNEILKFIQSALVENNEGETSVLIVGALYDLYMEQYFDYKVVVNPVNQSGSSSNEISDIDVYKDNQLFITNEVKDKNFRYTDVSHAVKKVIDSNFNKMLFVKGIDGALEGDDEYNIELHCQEKNFQLQFIDIYSLAKNLLILSPNPTVARFWNSITENAIHKKFKEKTISYFINLAESFGWK